MINIITKNSNETQGGLVTAAGGTEHGTGSIRWGGRTSEELSYRLFTTYHLRDGGVDAMDRDTDDEWDSLRGGVRIDWAPENGDSWMFDADVFRSTHDFTASLPLLTAPYAQTSTIGSTSYGGHLLGRWTRAHADESETTIQTYYDYADKDGGTFRERRHTFDFDVQHAFAAWGPHTVMVGTGYRYTENTFDNGTVALVDQHRGDNLWHAFVHDEIELIADTLAFRIGTKVEHNDYSGWEVQPDARLMWNVAEDHAVWGAVSRAVRVPNQINHDAQITLTSVPAGPLALVSVVTGQSSFESEDLTAFDLGYRFKYEDRFTLDVAGFFNNYEGLQSVVPGTPSFQATPVPHTVLPLLFRNNIDAETYGIEVAAAWQLGDQWRLSGSYSYLNLDADNRNPSALPGQAEGNSPENQIHVRSSWNVDAFEFDAMVSYTDNLSSASIPSFVRLDLRAAWNVSDQSSVEIVGQHLLDDRHPEFGSESWVIPTEIERAVYVQATTRF